MRLPRNQARTTVTPSSPLISPDARPTLLRERSSYELVTNLFGRFLLSPEKRPELPQVSPALPELSLTEPELAGCEVTHNNIALNNTNLVGLPKHLGSWAYLA